MSTDPRLRPQKIESRKAYRNGERLKLGCGHTVYRAVQVADTGGVLACSQCVMSWIEEQRGNDGSRTTQGD